MIFIKTSLAWDIRAIVRWLEHSLMSPFLGNTMYIDLFRSLGHLHVSRIVLHKIVTIFVPSFPVTIFSSYCIYDQNLALYYLERLESIRVVGTDRRSVLMIRVKVNSKSELVEDREGKSALYCCNLLL